MEYAAFVFAIFGLFAYTSLSSLKTRVDRLERQLTQIRGTSYHEDRKSLLSIVKSCIGKNVSIDLKEDHEDADIIGYGNTGHGSNTVMDADEEWLLVRIESPKGIKEKLIRMESVERISIRSE